MTFSLFYFIQRNQINVAIQSPASPCKFQGMCFSVIYPRNHTIFKSHSPAGNIYIFLTHGKNFIHGIFFCNWHGFLPNFIIGRMQTNGQSNLKLFFHQIPNSVYQSTGGYGNASLTNLNPLWMRQKFDKSD